MIGRTKIIKSKSKSMIMDAMEEMRLFLKYLQHKAWYTVSIFQYIFNFCSRPEIRKSETIISKYPNFPSLIEVVDEIKNHLGETYSEDIVVNEKFVIDSTFEVIGDLFTCIVQGYYATDSHAYLRNVVDIMEIVEIILGDAIYSAFYSLDHEDYITQGAYDLHLENFFEDYIPVIKMDGRILTFYSYDSSSEIAQYEFILNIEKVIEEKAHEENFFMDHLKKYYKNYNSILKRIRGNK